MDDVAAPRHPALATAHRTLAVGSPITDALIADALSEARAAHAELLAAVHPRRLDPRVTHLGEAVAALIGARPRSDAVEAARCDLAMAVRTPRCNEFVLDAVEAALSAVDRSAQREADLS